MRDADALLQVDPQGGHSNPNAIRVIRRTLVFTDRCRWVSSYNCLREVIVGLDRRVRVTARRWCVEYPDHLVQVCVLERLGMYLLDTGLLEEGRVVAERADLLLVEEPPTALTAATTRASMSMQKDNPRSAVIQRSDSPPPAQ